MKGPSGNEYRGQTGQYTMVNSRDLINDVSIASGVCTRVIENSVAPADPCIAPCMQPCMLTSRYNQELQVEACLVQTD